MARKTPELNLQPEEQKVLSQDFNLFYVPQENPLPAGMKEFTASLDNFVNGGATKAVIKQGIQGSGSSMLLRFVTTSSANPYSIFGFAIQYEEAGLR